MKKILVSVLLLTCAAFAQQSQPATPTQQTATHVDSCTPINGTAAAGSAATLTIPAPPSSQYIYITEIDIEINTSAATASEAVVTSTNLGASSIKWAIGLTAAAGAVSSLVIPYPTTLKSTTAATAVTIVGPTGVAGMLQNFNACYFYAY